MNPQQKICSVLKKIKEDNVISPYPGYIEFRFNLSLGGADILTDREERNILLKLEKEKIIEIQPFESEEDEAGYSAYGHDEIIFLADHVYIQLLDKFEDYFKKNCKYISIEKESNKINFWYYTNPFWLICFLLKLIWRHKILRSVIALLTAIITLLAIDYSLAWRNLSSAINFFKNF